MYSNCISELNPLEIGSKEYQKKADEALFAAVAANKTHVIAELIQLGACPTASHPKGRNGFTNSLIMVSQNDMTDGSSSKIMPLLLSAKNVRVGFVVITKAVNLTLIWQYNIDATDNNGNTALHTYAQKGQYGFVKMLIQAGARINVQNFQGNTPSHQAASRPLSNDETERNRYIKTLTMLLEASKPEDLLLTNKQGDTVLVKAVHQGNLDAAKTILIHLESLVSLQSVPFETVKTMANLPNHRGYSALHEAAIWGKLDLMRLLLECKIGNDHQYLMDVNATDLEGNSLLHLSCDRRLSGHIAMAEGLPHVKLILQSISNINAVNKRGESALHVTQVPTEFIQLLLSHNADASIADSLGNTAVISHVIANRPHNVELFIQHYHLKGQLSSISSSILKARDSEGSNVLHLLSEIDSASSIEILWKSIDKESFTLLASSQNKNSFTPIQAAIESKCLNSIVFYLTHLPNLSSSDIESIRRSYDSQGDSLLHLAAKMNSVDSITALLDIVKMDVNVENALIDDFSDGGTPLHVAAMAGAAESISLLVSYGASVNSQANAYNDTPLHLAIKFDQPSCVRLLLDLGASKEIKNRDGEAAVDQVKTGRGISSEVRDIFFPKQQ